MTDPRDYSPTTRPALPPHVELTPAAIRELFERTVPQPEVSQGEALSQRDIDTLESIGRANGCGAQSETGGDECRCVLHAGDVRCAGPICSTVDRWAAACRRSHWFEDETLRDWRMLAVENPDEAALWRRVARAAIAHLENDHE